MCPTMNRVLVWVSASHAQLGTASSASTDRLAYGLRRTGRPTEVNGRCDPCLREERTGGLRREKAPVPCTPAMADHVRASQV